ncbi:MAG: lyase family protein [Thaumarchaeota archaeon]|nr:lyase family protein [Candidatus Calditenuaceae archaeon]MDW8041679.1 lyase family protein [Nitrososphaerota archaeon]
MSFRSGRLEREMPEDVAKFISSLDVDLQIFDEVVLVNAAHLTSLERMGLIDSETLDRAIKALRSAHPSTLPMTDYKLEDVHMVIEEYLKSAVPEAGENLALGKSRNDAVAAAIRLRLMKYIAELVSEGSSLAEALISKARDHAETVFPLFTHEQVAAPGTFGFVLTYHASRILKSLRALKSLYDDVAESPLGAGPVGGTSVPHDRSALSELLGFKGPLLNALEASSSRDFIITYLGALCRLSVALTDLAEEIVRYVSMQLIEIGDEYCSTSSIMPHKRNPVVAEVARTIAAKALGGLTSLTATLARRFGGYVLDLQESTRHIWPPSAAALDSMRVMKGLIAGMRVTEEAVRAVHPIAGITEFAAHLALNRKMTFRRAHGIAARLSRLFASGSGISEVIAEGRALGLDDESLSALSDFLKPEKVVRSYRVLGSSHPDEVRRACDLLVLEVESLRKWAEAELEAREQVRMKLLGKAKERTHLD